MRVKGRSKDWSNLSSYLDGEISIRAKAKLEKRLQTQPDLQIELNQLRTTRAMIRSLPHRKVPHSFTLTPEMAKAGKKNTLVPMFSYASMASGLIAIVLLLVQFFPSTLVSRSIMAPEHAVAADMAFETEMDTSQTKNPEIIFWGGSPTSVVEGKGGGGPVYNAVPYEAPATANEESLQADTLLGGGAPVDESLAAAVPDAGVAVSEPMDSPGEVTESTTERSATITNESVAEEEAPAAEQEALKEDGGDTNPILGIRPDAGNEITYGTSIEGQTSLEESTFNFVAFIFLGLALLTGAFAIFFKNRPG